MYCSHEYHTTRELGLNYPPAHQSYLPFLQHILFHIIEFKLLFYGDILKEMVDSLGKIPTLLPH